MIRHVHTISQHNGRGILNKRFTSRKHTGNNSTLCDRHACTCMYMYMYMYVLWSYFNKVIVYTVKKDLPVGGMSVLGVGVVTEAGVLV